MAKKRSHSKKSSDKPISRQSNLAKKTPLKHAKKHPAPHARHPALHPAVHQGMAHKPEHKHEETLFEKVEDKLKHEERLILQKHVGKYRIPVGIKVLIVYLSFIGILYLASFFAGISSPTMILFGQIFTGPTAVIFNLVVMGLLGLVIYGLVNRKAYTFDLAIAWFGLGLLNAVLSFFLISSTRFAIFGDLMFISFLSQVVVNTLVIWYLLSEKKYFYAKEFHDRPWHHKDKVFVYTLVSFWVLVILIGFSSAISFYSDTTQIVDKTMIELQSTHPFFLEQTCLSKEGKEKDICLTVLATMYNTSDVAEVSDICSNVESDFLRFTCLRTLK